MSKTSEGLTQFGRALSELDIELIRAHSPQAKGRIERSFGTAQDRWIKELRLAGVTTREQGNALLEQAVLPEHNRRFSKPAQCPQNAHRPLGRGHNLAAILSVQEQRVVSNDYTIRFRNRFYQLLKPAYPGERGGKVVIELRLDDSMAIRFQGHYLKYQELPLSGLAGPSGSGPVEFSALAADASVEEEEGRGSTKESPAPGVQPTVGRSGRTPAEPYPPDGEAKDSVPGRKRPAEDHPWRKPFKRQK